METGRRLSVLNAARRALRSATTVLTAATTVEWPLRGSLGIIYLWFGALKLLGLSSVLELLRRAYPPLGTPPVFLALGLFEMALGGALLAGLWKPWTTATAIFHLVSTSGVLLFASGVAFAPYFPYLSMEGKYVVTNLVLLAALLALWLRTPRVGSPRAGSKVN